MYVTVYTRILNRSACLRSCLLVVHRFPVNQRTLIPSKQKKREKGR